nr:MAG TPA: hypothetical protein [Caudoviricetes sp.]
MWLQKQAVLLLVMAQSSQGCGVLAVPVSTLAGIPSMMVISGSVSNV